MKGRNTGKYAMANEEDSFIREVNEDLRSDQFKALWRQYGALLILTCVLIVVGTAGYRGYQYWVETQASASGDRFLAAMKLANDGKQDEAKAELDALEKDGFGAYPVLARMRAATLAAEAGDAASAAASFAEIADDKSVPDAIRDVARLRAAWLKIDTGTYDEVSALVEVLASPQNPMRHSAREALGLSAYKQGDIATAKTWFEEITNDNQTPGNVRSRAQILLDLIISNQDAG